MVRSHGFWAEVCSRLRAVDRAGELHQLLAPFSGQLASANGVTVFGSIDWALGILAATQERYEQAEGHFAAAAEIEASLGAPLFLARTHVGWARALIARGRPEDLERAQTMLEKAEDTATRLGAGGITRDVAECRAALAATGRDRPLTLPECQSLVCSGSGGCGRPGRVGRQRSRSTRLNNSAVLIDRTMPAQQTGQCRFRGTSQRSGTRSPSTIAANEKRVSMVVPAALALV